MTSSAEEIRASRGKRIAVKQSFSDELIRPDIAQLPKNPPAPPPAHRPAKSFSLRNAAKSRLTHMHLAAPANLVVRLPKRTPAWPPWHSIPIFSFDRGRQRLRDSNEAFPVRINPGRHDTDNPCSLSTKTAIAQHHDAQSEAGRTRSRRPFSLAFTRRNGWAARPSKVDHSLECSLE